jgi:hypothetical protein
MTSLFAVSILSTMLYNKLKYPSIIAQFDTIQIYDEIPVSNDRLLNFSAGAGYWIYYLGIAKFIQENYNLDTTDFIGTSAGAFVCSILAHNTPISFVLKQSLMQLERYSANIMGVIFSWNIGYKQTLTNCYNELNVTSIRPNMYSGVSRLTAYGFKKQYIDGGTNIDTLSTSLVASCWIPFITAPLFQPFIYIKDGFYVDGFWTGRDKSKHKKHLIIYPGKFSRFPIYAYWLWLGQDYNIRMFNSGYEDAKQNRHVFDEFFAEENEQSSSTV